MADLLLPGSYRVDGILDDDALVGAMLTVELAWVRALAATGGASAEDVLATEQAVAGFVPTLDPVAVEGAGNPVLPLVTALRTAIADTDIASRVHTGLTSHDVLDTALVLLARAAAEQTLGALDRVADALTRLAGEHRGSVMAGRTLTQYAVPVTFGLTAAQWLIGILDARGALADATGDLPVQCGGAAGTLSRAADLVDDPLATAAAFAAGLGLVAPTLPWHTRRTPVTRLADALVQTCDALGVLADDVLLLGRPEVGEVGEGAAAGRGGSSTMPHKQNPVLSVLVSSAAQRAPLLGAQLHLSAARAVDQRPDGAWHAEWSALRTLLGVTAVAADQAAELTEHLDVHPDHMRRRAESVADQLLAERGDTHDRDLTAYLGVSSRLVERALLRHREVRDDG